MKFGQRDKDAPEGRSNGLASLRLGMFDKLKHHIISALPGSHEPLFKRLFVATILLILALTIGLLFIFTTAIAVLSISLPDVRNFEKLAGVESTIIFDRDGGILYTIHGEENRKYVPITEISPFLQKATLAIEDDGFYEHIGFDLPGIIKGALYEVFSIGKPRGGSTITQQLAKNAFLTRRRTYTRKLKELILAIRLERAYNKDKIFELYLNRIPYGNNAYGAELASKMYFGKPARTLTLGESAVLAALPKAPTYYSPYGPHAYSTLQKNFDDQLKKGDLPQSIEDLENDDYTIGLIGRTVLFSPKQSIYLPGRSDFVLARMEELGVISEEEQKQALQELQQIDFQKYREAIRAAHFVFEVRAEIERRFGKELVAQGGLQVYTTLDPDLQKAAEEAVSEQIKLSKDAHGVSTAALFAVDAKSGQVLSMVGSADYFDTEAGGNNNHVFARRQPGSSFKPITYAKAFLNRYGPATVIYDTPTNFGSNYEPQNFEGAFKGPMSIRTALGQSRNIPALKAYFMAGEEKEIVDLANKMGIKTLKPDANYGPPLAIGAGEVMLAEMVQAFSVFATGGIKRDYYSILRVVDRDGDIIYERKPEENVEQEVLDPQVAYLINSILSDKSVSLGVRLDVPGHITAAKTGTSNKEITPVKILPSNLWTVGYTPSLVTGVWAGNSDGSALKLSADGYTVAAPIWGKFMAAALKEKPDEPFHKPEGIKSVTVAKASGKLPSKDTPASEQVSEIFASFSVPTEIDDAYSEAEVNERDNLLPNAFTPKEYIKKKVFINHHDPIADYPRWLEGIKKWVSKTREEDPNFPDFPPTEETKMFTAETAGKQPTIQILTPAAFSAVSGVEKFSVSATIQAPNGLDRVEFYIDDKSTPNAVKRAEPFEAQLRMAKNATAGKHLLRAKVYDKIGYVAEASAEVEVVK